MESSPPEYPSWVFHWNGRRRIVVSEEEFAALRPAGYRYGLPDMAAMGLDWKPLHGPFAPLSTHETNNHLRPSGPMCVCARRFLTYNQRARVRGEIFLLQGRMEDADLWESGAIMVYPQGANPRYMDQETGRWFADEKVLAHYAQCYEHDDVRGLGFEWPATPQAPAVPSPVAPSRPPLGRPKGGLLDGVPWETVYEKLKDVAPASWRYYSGKKHPGAAELARAYGVNRKALSTKINENGKTWKILYPGLFPDFYR